MGRRSRKRAAGATRAERDAARQQRASVARPPASPPRRSGERPPAPWGRFPLSELLILLGIVLILWGGLSGRDGEERIVAGLVIASLGGGELALREHLAGYRSHSALLAGVAAFVAGPGGGPGPRPGRVWGVMNRGARHLFFGDEEGRPGTLITCLEYSELDEGTVGRGSTHHFALSVGSEEELRAWRDYLTSRGVPCTEVLDRTYFKSLYLRDPDGHLIELATLEPGLTADEPLEELGRRPM